MPVICRDKFRLEIGHGHIGKRSSCVAIDAQLVTGATHSLPPFSGRLRPSAGPAPSDPSSPFNHSTQNSLLISVLFIL